MMIIEYLLPHMNSRFEKVSYFFNDGGGPSEPGADGAFPEEGSERSREGSQDSVSVEGATASAPPSRPSISGTHSGHHLARQWPDSWMTDVEGGGPQHGGYLYDDEDSSFQCNDLVTGIGSSNYGPGEFPSLGDEKLERDQLRQPFMSENFDLDSHRPPSFALSAAEREGGSPRDLGLIELQPLISKDRNMNNPSLPLHKNSPLHHHHHHQQQQHTSLSSPINTHTSPSPPSSVLATHNDSDQGPSHSGSDTSLRGTKNPSTAQPISSSPSSSTSSSSPHKAPLVLRLPALNAPPGSNGRSFRTSASDRDYRDLSLSVRGNHPHSNSHTNTQGNSSPHLPQHIRDPLHPTLLSSHTNSACSQSNLQCGVPDMEEGAGSQEASRIPSVTDLSQATPLDPLLDRTLVDTTSSEEGSKGSSKSSGSSSLMNGLTNGHIPLISFKNKPAPC